MGHCYDVNYDDGKYVSGTYETGLFLDVNYFKIWFLKDVKSFKDLLPMWTDRRKCIFPPNAIYLLHTHYATTVMTKKPKNRKMTLLQSK